MKINLYSPPVHHYTGYHCNALPPLSTPLLAAVLRRAGHDARSIDLEALHTWHVDWSAVDADVIGITGMTMAAQGMREMLAEIRGSGYHGFVAVGGIHATMNPEEVWAWGADLVVTGECEGNIARLLVNRQEGIHAGEPLPIEDVPAPAWDYHTPDIRNYTGNYAFMRPNPGISMWSRGCPYKCVFCSNLIYQRQPTRYRPPANIAAEMDDLRARGVRNVYIYDDELIGAKQPDGWMHEIADRVTPLGMQWVTMGRCSQKFITPKLLADMKRAGCTTILWGVESFSAHTLQAMQKHTTPDDIWHSLRAAKQAGIKNLLFTMIGNYQETAEDCEETARCLRSAYKQGLVDYLQTFVCSIMPGTELERLSKAEGWYTPAEHGNARMKIVNHSTPWLTADEIKKYRALYRKVCPVML